MMSDIWYYGGARENDFSGIYCKMAMKSYYHASDFYKKIQHANFSLDSWDEKNELDKCVIATVVFSAMCLEAFFNDYIAAVLGDSSAHSIYDKLSPDGKFYLIVDFIFREQVDKSQSCYGGIKTLFRLRNDYVHNKSKEVKGCSYTAQEISELEEMLHDPQNILEPPLLDKTEIDNDMRNALEALKTIRNVARYFDEHDSSCWAMIRLFGEYNFDLASPYEQEYMEEIFTKLGIKRRG